VRKTATILLIALLALTLVASACGKKKSEGSSSPTAPSMSAQDILKKATEAGSGIKSSQVGLDMAISLDMSASASPDPSLQVFSQGPVKITGDMATQVEPMAVDGTLSLGMAGQTLSLGIKVVDNKMYMDWMGTWYEAPPEVTKALNQQQTASPGTTQNYGDLMSTLQSMGIDPNTWAKELTVVGTEQVDGATCYHVKMVVDTGKVVEDIMKMMQDPKVTGIVGADQQKQLEQLGGLSPTDLEQLKSLFTSAQVDMWVDSTNFYTRKMVFDAKLDLSAAGGATSGVSGMGLNMTVTQSAFNEPVTVTAPESPQSWKELQKAFGGSSPLGGSTGL
jgi:hypothetical protein